MAVVVVVVALVIPLSFFYQIFNHRAQVRTCDDRLSSAETPGKGFARFSFATFVDMCFLLASSSFLSFSHSFTHSFSLPTLTRSASLSLSLSLCPVSARPSIFLG